MENSHPEQAQAERRAKPGGWRPALVFVVAASLVAVAALVWSGWRIGRSRGSLAATSSTVPAESQPALGSLSDPDPVVALVNGEPIRLSAVDAATAALPSNMQAPLATPAGRKAIVEELVRMKVLEQYARTQKLEQRPEISGQLTVTVGNLLANAAINELLRDRPAVDPRQLYERNKQRFETVNVQQIVIPYEGASGPVRDGFSPLPEPEARARAEQVVRRLRQGEDFSAMVRTHSADPSARFGGELAGVRRGNFPEHVDQALFSLPPGSITDPIRTPAGYQIFKVLDRTLPTFEQMQPVLEQQERQLQANELVEAMVAEAQVEIDSRFVGKGVGVP